MAIVCAKCGHDNPSGVPVCTNCAAPLANLCPNCNFENPQGFKFCGNCGANLLTAALLHASDEETLRRLRGYIPTHLVDKILRAGKQLEGERRTVTVLFSDIVGFTSISEQLDPEQVYTIIDSCVTAFREEIYKHEGTLDKFMGDGVMALFGAPIAHEDDPARAVRCAMGMQESIQRINRDLVAPRGVKLEVRIGLNLGTVIVGDVGSDLKMNYTALGDTVNVAARLQSLAEPGAILVSRAVYDRTSALFEFKEEGDIRVKGRIEPVEIYAVKGPRREPGRVRGITGLAAPMVGREKELDLGKTIANGILGGRNGAVVLVSGDPGIGKSRLVSELKSHLQTLPAQVYEAGCSSYGEFAYDVFIKLLQAYFRIQPEDDEVTKRGKIEGGVQSILFPPQALVEILPYIENLLAIPIVEKRLSDRIRHLEPAQLRQQTFLAVRDLFSAAASREPLFLVLEDLHWIDRMSLGLLFFLFNAVESSRLAVICTSRPTENQIAPQILNVASSGLGDQFVHIPLRPLTTAESVALIDSLFTKADFPPSLRELIPERAEGNPFFLEEIIRMLIDQHIIRPVGERWEMAPGTDLAGLEVPRTLEGLIMSRVDNLTDAGRYTLQCASVIGTDFTPALLNRVIEQSAPYPDNTLSDLVERELLMLHTSQPETQYEFKHILTQMTVYNSLLSGRRERMHARVAEAIEEIYAAQIDLQVERLAFHFLQANDSTRALPHLLRSAEKASAGFATEQALDYLHSALDIANQANATPDQRIRIFEGLGDARNFLGEYDGSTASYRTALEIAHTAPASPQQARVTAEIARRLGRVYERRGDNPEALRCLETALKEINRDTASERAAERARLYLDIGWVQYRQGKLEEAFHWDMRALGICEGLDYYAEMGSAYNRLAAIFVDKYDWHRSTEYALKGLSYREMVGDTDGIARSHSNLGIIAADLGDWEQAIVHFKKSLEIRLRIGQAKGLCNAYTNLGRVYVLKGDAAVARQHISTARALAEKIHDPDQICLALNALAEAESLDENWNAAIILLEGSLKTAAEIGSKDHISQAFQIMGEAHLGGGDAVRASEDARRALEIAEETGNRQTEAGALRVLGAAERAGGHWQNAEADLSQSISMFCELQNQFEEAKSELELALLYSDQGMRLDSRAMLERCLDSFTRFGVEKYRKRTEDALGLTTPRERKV